MSLYLGQNDLKRHFLHRSGRAYGLATASLLGSQTASTSHLAGPFFEGHWKSSPDEIRALKMRQASARPAIDL